MHLPNEARFGGTKFVRGWDQLMYGRLTLISSCYHHSTKLCTKNITHLLSLAPLHVLHTRNNTDGNKLMIFSSVALYYGDTSKSLFMNHSSFLLRMYQWFLCSTQYKSLLNVLDSFDRHALAQKYLKYKPEHSVGEDLRGWWRYAITAVLEEDVKRRTKMWSWRHIKHHRWAEPGVVM